MLLRLCRYIFIALVSTYLVSTQSVFAIEQDDASLMVLGGAGLSAVNDQEGDLGLTHILAPHLDLSDPISTQDNVDNTDHVDPVSPLESKLAD